LHRSKHKAKTVQPEGPGRDEQVAQVFAGTLEPIHQLFCQLDLTEDESESLDRELYAWFYRFTRRCGHETLSARSMRCALLAGAVQLLRDVAVLKLCSIPLLPNDLKEIAEQLGFDPPSPSSL
jgi:hypothetical protein